MLKLPLKYLRGRRPGADTWDDVASRRFTCQNLYVPGEGRVYVYADCLYDAASTDGYAAAHMMKAS